MVTKDSIQAFSMWTQYQRLFDVHYYIACNYGGYRDIAENVLYATVLCLRRMRTGISVEPNSGVII